jgi:protease-4
MSTVPPGDPGYPATYGRPAPPPQQIVIQQQQPSAFGRYGRFLLLALAIAVMAIIGQNASYRSYFSAPDQPQEKFHSLSETANEKIAIIRIEGTILETDGFVKKQIDRVREDKDVVGVVLRIDSPGGTVTASDFLFHELRRLAQDRKPAKGEFPIAVSMGSICASGGYYLAMAVGERPDAIYAEPSTWTGSIGVVIPHYDLSGLLADWNVKDDSIASDKRKLMGSPTRALSEEDRAEERKLLQTLVDESYERFKDIVRFGRPKLKADDAALDKAATGQIFTADQALDRGLIDKKGFLDEAVRRVAEMAGRQPENLRCVKYEEPPTTLSTLLGAKSAGTPASQVDLSALSDLGGGKAYYLWNWLPALLSQPR